jgi:hypothetical protein
MPTVFTRYVTWVSRGKRNHGSSAFDITPPLIGDAVTQYAGYAPPALSWTDMHGNHDANFAFWSVTGASDGPQVFTDNQVSAHVGTSPIHATAWYIPAGGPSFSRELTGIIIDAFDVGLGAFVDDDFVDVTSDPSLTTQANDEGFVPTGAAEDVEARTPVHADPFTHWLVIPANGEKVTYRDVFAAVKTDAFAFAFYQPTKIDLSYRPPDEILSVEYTAGVANDGLGYQFPRGSGGPGRPVPPQGPLFVRQLTAGLALADLGSVVDAELRGALSRIATAQIESSARNIVLSIERRERAALAVNGEPGPAAIPEPIA